MTRKDYVAIAAALRQFYMDDERESIHTASGAVEYVAHNIANVMARDNPRFDRQRFLRACGIEK